MDYDTKNSTQKVNSSYWPFSDDKDDDFYFIQQMRCGKLLMTESFKIFSFQIIQTHANHIKCRKDWILKKTLNWFPKVVVRGRSPSYLLIAFMSSFWGHGPSTSFRGSWIPTLWTMQLPFSGALFPFHIFYHTSFLDKPLNMDHQTRTFINLVTMYFVVFIVKVSIFS